MTLWPHEPITQDKGFTHDCKMTIVLSRDITTGLELYDVMYGHDGLELWMLVTFKGQGGVFSGLLLWTECKWYAGAA